MPAAARSQSSHCPAKAPSMACAQWYSAKYTVRTVPGNSEHLASRTRPTILWKCCATIYTNNMQGTILHYSFDLWLTLIRSNPAFKRERAQYFFHHHNGKAKPVEE